eukprot:6459258-Amphidinium_carterae.1
MDIPVTLTADGDALLDPEDMTELSEAVNEYDLALQEWRQEVKPNPGPKHGESAAAAAAATSSSTKSSSVKQRVPKPGSSSGAWTKEEVLALLPALDCIMISKEQTWHSRWRIEFRGWPAPNRMS